MKGQFLKKTIAGLMALLIVSGGMPLQPVSKIFERTAITAKATNIAPTPITGLVAEKNIYGYWKFQALANAGEYDEESDFNYWYSVELLEIYDDTMSDEEKNFEIFEYNSDYSLYYTTSVPGGNYPGKYKVYYGISDTDDVKNPSSFEVIITKEGTVIPSESVSESGQGASSTIVSTTVENGIYTGFTATSGTNGTSTSEGYAKLVDGNKSTKWCIVNPNNTCYVEFNSDIPFIPTGYILTTGNDNSKYTGRNPAGWKLYGKLNENDDWTVLAEVTQDTVLEDKDYQSYDFDIENNTSAYQYFRFEFSQTKGSNVFQLSELQFKGEAVEEATDLTEPEPEPSESVSESVSEPTEPESTSEPTEPSESVSEPSESEFMSEPTEPESTSEPTEPVQPLVSVTYLDENGTEQTVDAIPLNGSETTLSAGTYVVSEDIAYSYDPMDLSRISALSISGDVKIILMDGKTLSIGREDAGFQAGITESDTSTLSIYGQTNGTGKLNVYTSYTNMNVSNYRQYSGTVNLFSGIGTAFFSDDVKVLGGTLNAVTKGTTYAISASSNIELKNCTVTAETEGKTAINLVNTGKITIDNAEVTANGSITAENGNLNIDGGKITFKGESGFSGYQMNISLKNADDFVQANGYEFESVVIANGQALTDGENLCYGTLTSEQASALAGKTLTKANSVPVSYVDVDKRIMTLPLYSTANAGYIDISTPYLDGYTYKCLTVNGEECADMLEVIAKAKAILKDNPEANITIAAVYEQNAEKFIVTVTGGTLNNGISGDSYQVGTELTVTASPAEEGFQFDHWENNGKIASYNEVYSFHVPAKEITLEAVYSPVGTEVEKVGTAYIESVTTINGNKIAFVSKVAIPEGARILKAGIVANTQANLNGSELTTDTAQFTRYDDSKCYDYLAYKFTWTKGNVSEDDVWCVRSYLVYSDENGEHTVYGELVRANLNGIISE